MAETVEPQSKPTTTATRSISVAKALQDIGQKKLSGQLTIRDPNSDSLFWRVYVGSGHIHFATSAIGQQERLAYLLQQYPQLESFDSNKFSSDYQYLCH